MVHVSRQLSQLARALPGIDLFDPAPLRPFTDQGLTNGLLVAGALSLFGLFALDQGLSPMLASVATLALALVGVAIALPLRGVRDRIRQAKRAALRDLDARIAQAARARPPMVEPGRLADWIALRGHLAAVREWPFDTRALRTAALYVLIPLGSWIASGLVQHLLERFLLAG